MAHQEQLPIDRKTATAGKKVSDANPEGGQGLTTRVKSQGLFEVLDGKVGLPTPQPEPATLRPIRRSAPFRLISRPLRALGQVAEFVEDGEVHAGEIVGEAPLAVGTAVGDDAVDKLELGTNSPIDNGTWITRISTVGATAEISTLPSSS